MCFLCLFNTSQKENHYKGHIYGEANNGAEKSQLNVHLLGQHMKLGLMCSFAKAINKNENALKELFPKLSASKISNECFTGSMKYHIVFVTKN